MQQRKLGINAGMVVPQPRIAASRWMWGGYPGADTDPRRRCKVCDGRPILRYVGKAGFCRLHIQEAWIEQARQPVEGVWIPHAVWSSF